MASSVPPSRSKRPLKPRPGRLGPRAASRQMCVPSGAMPSPVISFHTGASMTGQQKVADVEIWAESVRSAAAINRMD